MNKWHNTGEKLPGTPDKNNFSMMSVVSNRQFSLSVGNLHVGIQAPDIIITIFSPWKYIKTIVINQLKQIV